MAIKSNLDKKLKANTQQRHQGRGMGKGEGERQTESYIGYFQESIYL